MGYAVAGLLGIGLGLRTGLFGLIAGSIAAFCAVIAWSLYSNASLGVSFIGFFMIVFEIGALFGMLVRQGVFGQSGQETPVNGATGQVGARDPAAPAGV